MLTRLAFGFLVTAFSIGMLGCGFGSKNPNFCPGRNPNNNCSEPADGPTTCTSNAECSAPTAVCDVNGTMTCVQCTPDEDAACSGTTPVCPGTTCEGCTAHDQCDSAVCLPDGSCGDDSNVAYVDPTGTDNAMCTSSMPCTDVAKALDTARPFVKFSGTTDQGGTVAIDNQNVSLLAAPNAKLVRTSNGIVLEVKGTSQVAIFDLEISGGGGTQGIGVSLPAGNTATVSLVRVNVLGNVGGGLSASGGSVSMTQSTISNNAGGGLSVSGGEFDITNSIIASNGGAATAFGGVLFSQTGSGTRKFEFNTVTNNVAAAGTTTGVVCALVTQAVTFSNNIVFDNQTGGGRTQVGGANCAWTFSDIGPDTVSGTGNINMDPMFVNPSQSNFHLMPGSPAKDAADPAATLATDIDGDTRPQGPARDMGADEVP